MEAACPHAASSTNFEFFYSSPPREGVFKRASSLEAQLSLGSACSVVAGFVSGDLIESGLIDRISLRFRRSRYFANRGRRSIPPGRVKTASIGSEAATFFR